MFPAPAAPPSLAALPCSDAPSGTTTADIRAPAAPASGHRAGHSCACDASSPPSAAGWPPAPRARNPPPLPAPRPSVSPLRRSHARPLMPGTMPPHPLALSATVPPQASLPPAPKCSSCSIGLPGPLLPSDGPDWGQTRPLRSPPLPSPVWVSAPAFGSASRLALQSLLWTPAAPCRGPSSVSSSVRSSFENCYSFSRVDLLILIARYECV